MSDWETQFAAMRVQFFERARTRVDQMQTLLSRVDMQTPDVDLLLTIRKEFHWLSGVGGTYKLPELSTFGYEAEQMIEVILENRRTPTPEEIASLNSIVASTKSVLQNV